MDKQEKTIKKNLVYKGRILSLYVDDVKCPNGNISQREIINHHGGVGVLLVSEKGILLEKQYRYAYKEELYEIPAGKIEENEDTFEAIKRELKEETGYVASYWTYLGEIYPSPGYTNEKIHIYLAKNETKEDSHPDDDECIEWDFYSIEEVQEMIKNGTIKDAKTIAAVYFYLSNHK